MAYSDDNYGDGEAGEVKTQNTADVEQEGNEEHKDGEYDTTAVVPKELCPDMKVGDEMVVKILRVDEHSYEVGYAPEKGGKSEEKESSAPAPDEGSMASMME